MKIHEKDTLLFYAFRYALGRKSYAVDDVASLLIKYKDLLSKIHRERIVKEINEAINLGHAGMDWDIRVWLKVSSEMM